MSNDELRFSEADRKAFNDAEIRKLSPDLVGYYCIFGVPGLRGGAKRVLFGPIQECLKKHRRADHDLKAEGPMIWFTVIEVPSLRDFDEATLARLQQEYLENVEQDDNLFGTP